MVKLGIMCHRGSGDTSTKIRLHLYFIWTIIISEMAIRGKMKSLVKKLITPVALATALFFSPVKANVHSTEKINSPEYAEEVRTDKAGYQHWRFEDVWYSNAPLEKPFKNSLKNLYKTTGWEDIRMNPFYQPNDSNLVWYGSGDLDSNNVLDQADLDSMLAKYGHVDQADIDGDSTSFTENDYALLFEHINNDSLLPSDWNQTWNIGTQQDRKDWLNKMLAIDKTDTITYTDTWKCGEFMMQTLINFYGFKELKDSSIVNDNNYLTKFDFSNNGRFNIPVFDVRIRGPLHHVINSCLIGENPLNWDDWYFFEPQNDSKVIIGDWNMVDSAFVTINHTYFLYYEPMDKTLFVQEPFIEFKLNNGLPELIKYDERLILERPVGIKPNNQNLLEKFVLKQNYPNPFNSQTQIKYFLPVDDKVSLNVYNLKGKLVETLVNEKQRAGEYSIGLDASKYSSGIYFYNLTTSSGINKTKKMMLVK